MKKNMLQLMSAAVLTSMTMSNAMENKLITNTQASQVSDLEDVLDRVARASAATEGITKNLRDELSEKKSILSGQRLKDFKTDARLFEAIEWLNYSETNFFGKKEKTIGEQITDKKKKNKSKKPTSVPTQIATDQSEKKKTSAEQTERQKVYFAALEKASKPVFKEWAGIDFSEDEATFSEATFSDGTYQRAVFLYEWAKAKHDHRQTLSSSKTITETAQTAATKSLQQLQTDLKNKQTAYETTKTSREQELALLTNNNAAKTWEKMKAQEELNDWTKTSEKELDDLRKMTEQQESKVKELTQKTKVIERNYALMNYKILRTKNYLLALKNVLEGELSELTTPINQLESNINTLNFQTTLPSSSQTAANELLNVQKDLLAQKTRQTEIKQQIDDLNHKIEVIETPRSTLGSLKKYILG